MPVTCPNGFPETAVVAHVFGNMEDEDLNILRGWILHNISLLRVNYFLGLSQGCNINPIKVKWVHDDKSNSNKP